MQGWGPLEGRRGAPKSPLRVHVGAPEVVLEVAAEVRASPQTGGPPSKQNPQGGPHSKLNPQGGPQGKLNPQWGPPAEKTNP